MADEMLKNARPQELESQIGEEDGLKEQLLRMCRQNKLAAFSAVLILVVILIAIFAPVLAPYGEAEQDLISRLQGPSAAHWFGTDELGRDVFSRILYGSRLSLTIGILPSIISLVVGIFFGLLAGYFGGWVDRGIQCLVAVFQGLPGMSLMIAVAAILPENNFRLIIALTLTSWAGFSRIVRSEVIRIRGELYMESIKSLGASHGYIVRKYVLPNVLPVVIVLLTLRIGTSLLSASALSYLGLGVSPPTADWGVMISDARTYFRSYPLMMIAPGTGITLFCLSINLLGDAMRERIRK